MRAIAASAAVIMVLVLAGCGSAQASGEPLVVAGVLEHNGTGWQLVGGNHVALGVESVTSNEDRIVISFTFEANRVISFIADPDGPMIQQGYAAGATCFLDRAEIDLARHGEAISPTDARVEYGNIWFYGLLEP